MSHNIIVTRAAKSITPDQHQTTLDAAEDEPTKLTDACTALLRRWRKISKNIRLTAAADDDKDDNQEEKSNSEPHSKTNLCLLAQPTRRADIGCHIHHRQ